MLFSAPTFSTLKTTSALIQYFVPPPVPHSTHVGQSMVPTGEQYIHCDVWAVNLLMTGVSDHPCVLEVFVQTDYITVHILQIPRVEHHVHNAVLHFGHKPAILVYGNKHIFQFCFKFIWAFRSTPETLAHYHRAPLLEQQLPKRGVVPGVQALLPKGYQQTRECLPRKHSTQPLGSGFLLPRPD